MLWAMERQGERRNKNKLSHTIKRKQETHLSNRPLCLIGRGKQTFKWHLFIIQFHSVFHSIPGQGNLHSSFPPSQVCMVVGIGIDFLSGTNDQY